MQTSCNLVGRDNSKHDHCSEANLHGHNGVIMTNQIDRLVPTQSLVAAKEL